MFTHQRIAQFPPTQTTQKQLKSRHTNFDLRIGSSQRQRAERRGQLPAVPESHFLLPHLRTQVHLHITFYVNILDKKTQYYNLHQTYLTLCRKLQNYLVKASSEQVVIFDPKYTRVSISLMTLDTLWRQTHNTHFFVF